MTARKSSASKDAVSPPRRKAAKPDLKKSTAGSAASKKAPRRITPRQALANTLTLLEEKNEKARQPPNYPTGHDDRGHSLPSDPIGTMPHSQLQAGPSSHPQTTEGHSLPRGNQGKRNQR